MEGQFLSGHMSVRLQPFLFRLLSDVSKKVGLSKSELVRAAVITWLENAPEDELPLDLRIRVATVLVANKVSIIKDLRYLYHALEKAKMMKRHLEVSREINEFPPHVIDYLQRLENDLIEIVNDFDQVLKGSPVEVSP